MYLRVSSFQSDPARLDEGVAFLRDKIIPALKQVPGFLGATCVVDRGKGTGAASTLWDSLQSMNNAEHLGQQSRQQSEEATGIEVIDVDRFEITQMDLAQTIQLPSYARIITGYGDPKNADALSTVIREEILPKLKGQPGFRGFWSGVNRMTGRGFTVSSWTTPEQREASNAAVAESTMRASQVGALYGMEINLVETVLAEVKLPATA